ncbi:transcriptional regulator, LysR family protein, partial [mine drainage metagenome]
SLHLTEFGAVVLDYADSIFGLGQELMATVRGGLGQRQQHLRVGVVATLSRNFTENLLRPVFGRPEIRLTLQSGSLAELLEQLRVHNLDLLLSNRPVVAEAERPWRCMPLSRQSVCLIGPPRLGRRRLRLPDDLTGLPLVLPGPSSDVRTHFDLWCERRRVTVEV